MNRPQTIAANLRWFAVVYAMFAAGVIALRYAVEGTSFEAAAKGLEIIANIGLVYIAGYQFARRNPAWEKTQRHGLAVGYTIIIGTVAVISSAIVLLIDPITSPPPSSDVYSALIAVFAVILAIIYVIARIILQVVKGIVTAQRGQQSGGIQA